MHALQGVMSSTIGQVLQLFVSVLRGTPKLLLVGENCAKIPHYLGPKIDKLKTCIQVIL
jgi:hypothetical protein